MGNVYGSAAVNAVIACHANQSLSEKEAWKQAIEQLTASKSSREKGCPRNAFLGLCYTGWVKGISARKLDDTSQNGLYAVAAAKILFENSMSDDLGASSLWRKVVGKDKASNGQMQVVLALYKEGLLQRP